MSQVPEAAKIRTGIPAVIRNRLTDLAGRIASAQVALEVADRERQQWIAELRQRYGMIEIDEVTGIMWTIGPVARQDD